MRTFKRFLSLALVLVMAISLMSVAVFAEGETTDATLTATDEEFAALSNSQKIVTLGGSEVDPVTGSSIVTYLEEETKKGVIMWVDDVASRKAICDRFLNEKMNVEGLGFPISVKKSNDEKAVEYYIPKADLVANANDGQYHYYKLDDILVEAGNSFTSITMFFWGNAVVNTAAIPAFTEDTYVDLYFRIKVDGDVSGKEFFTDEAGNEYHTKYSMNQCVVVKDERVAEVGGAQYGSLQDAVNAAEDGATINVFANISDETVTVNKALTITGDVTLNNVTIKDVPPVPAEELAALTDADIYNGCQFTNASTAPFYHDQTANPVYTEGSDPNGKKVGIANAGAENVTAEQLAAFKAVTANGVSVGYAPTQEDVMIPAAEIVANDGQYHVYKVENFVFTKDTNYRYFHMFEDNGVRVWKPFTSTEDTVVDYYVSMRVDGDITCEDPEALPVYYINKVVVAYHRENALKLDGLTFTGDSTVNLCAAELTVENCAFNTTTTPVQVNGKASVKVMSTTTVGDNSFTMANISAPSDFTGSLAVGVTTDESGNLTGGTFNYDPTAQMAAGCTVEETDGLYEIVKLPAEFNGVAYDSLQKAIDAAKTAGGGTVKLTSNEEVGTVILPAGVTLDLDVYTLTAEYLIGLNGSKLIATPKINATAAYGKLVVAKDNVLLPEDAALPSPNYNYHVLPVWNAAEGAYEFALLRVNNTLGTHGLTVTEDKIEYRFRHQPSSYYKNNLLNDGGLDNGVKVTLTLSYENDLGKAEQTFVYNDDFFAEVNNASNMDYTFKLENYEAVGVDLSGEYEVTITIAIVTDCGMGHYITENVELN